MKLTKRWWLLVIISLGVMLPFAAPYFTLNPANSRVPITSASLQFPLLVSHIGFAFVALITGFFQFIDPIRTKRPEVHRLLGRGYMCSVLISGLLALAVICYIDNFTKATSFLALSILWLLTSWKGYRAAVTKRFDEHRIWMLRSFGVTLVAVSGRLVVPVLMLTYSLLNGFSLPHGRTQMIEVVLNINIWVGLILNFILVEWVLLKNKK